MAVKNTPWSYRKGRSPLHRLPAGFKLAFLLLLSLAAFFPGPQQRAVLSAIALILILLSLIAKINPLTLLRGSGPLFFIILAVFLFQGVELSPPGFNRGSLPASLVFCVRIGAAFAAGSLLFAVTTSGEIRKSLSRAESFFRVKKPRLSLSISLMLGFLPAFFVVWEERSLAWKSRAGKNRFSRLAVLVPLAIESMMVKAVETAEALEARGIGSEK